MKQIILTHTQIEQKINRLAFQLIENTFELDTIYIGGITGNGIVLAEKLKKIIEHNSDQKIVLFEVILDKEQPLSQPIQLTIDPQELNDKTVVLVDDVLNSGKTMQYGLMKILEQPVYKIYTVVLIDRKHRRYPIKANFFGLRLTTILMDHVEVSLAEGNYSAQLF
ncbi:phosphoribosyltransferase [Crocinitomicaceae bacterium CZZ-1]|uniref:Phosphoribosyltransferase n=1 Tax=Taishania pollutisoli TaxID=2766479 RepID=A0A8J6TTA5_9FLAO|nr:phosphoribosyltransferase family protein [Taishania pollutisoli]MBC9812847.1 phosphoribosyltransferase [Taishania pollutisoli]MBX2949702.1 phosphoribosyltransferase [Crocinitomicaceae bacterium]NGF76122.1 phosphoribosyltransferase [Fluviicola sp. SGL-29]